MENLENRQQEAVEKIFDDETFKAIRQLQDKENNLSVPAVEDIMKIMKTNLEAKSDFNVMTAYNSLAKCIMFTSQAVCGNEEHYNAELEKSHELAVKKFMPMISPQPNAEGNIEINDEEDYSLRRLMMALAHTMDYVLWRVLLADYSEIRQDIEEEAAGNEGSDEKC